MHFHRHGRRFKAQQRTALDQAQPQENLPNLVRPDCTSLVIGVVAPFWCIFAPRMAFMVCAGDLRVALPASEAVQGHILMHVEPLARSMHNGMAHLFLIKELRKERMGTISSRLYRSAALMGLALAGSMAAQAQTAAPAEAPAAAPAAAPTPDNTYSFNVGLISDYRYRGISQSRLKPAISGGFDYSHVSGFYAGTWLSSIKWIKDAGGGSDAEWDVYGGYKGTAGPIGYDVGLLHYHYPSHHLAVSPNTTEVYGAVTWEMVTLKYSHAFTNLFGFADSKNSGYLDLSANFDLGNGWSVVPHVGRQVIRHNSPYSYTDYSVTLNKDFGNGLSASAAIVGTNADKTLYVTPSGRFTGKTAVVVGVKYSF